MIAGAAASAVHGAKWVDQTEPIEILLGERRRQSGLIVRTDRISVGEVEDLDGLTVTTPARTAYDLGRYQKRYTAIGRLDALLRAAPYSADEVMVLMQRYGPVRGIRQLRELLPLVDPGAESPMESRWRLIFIDNGFPIPETQVPVLDDAGEPFAYLDMGWRHIQLAVEYDGEQHRTDPQYRKDQRRLPAIERRSWNVIRIFAGDTTRDVLRRTYEMWLLRGGPEIDEMAWASRTFPPVRTFGRYRGAA